MIRCLDLETVSRLRGGMLIDSTESAIRELVSNAIDAEAHHIRVKLHLGTLSVCVEDDGTGMVKENLDKAGIPHHTSKFGKESIGFRGEALNALVNSSSNVVLRSKTINESDWNTKSFRKQKELSVQVLDDFFAPTYGAQGTVVMVARLFGPAPVRWELAMENQKPMLDSIRVKLFETVATKPDVCLSMYVNDGDLETGFRKIIDTSDCATITEAYSSLFGQRNFERYEDKDGEAILTLFVSQESVQTSRLQFVFLNNTPVHLSGSERRSISDYISRAKYTSVKGYFGRSTKGCPSFIILVKQHQEDGQLPGQKDSRLVYKQVFQSLQSLFKEVDELGETPKKRTRRSNTTPQGSPSTPIVATPESTPESPQLSQVTQDMFVDNCQIISQVVDRFILLRDKNSLYIADQHACDERIQYEHLLRDFLDNLHDPFIDLRIRCDEIALFEVDSRELSTLVEKKDHLQTFGIDFESDTAHVYVTHLPAILIPKASNVLSLKAFLLGWAEDLQQKHTEPALSQDWFLAIQQIPRGIRDSIITKSCKQAIKFGEILSHGEMVHLLSELSKCRLFTQCAHGRPTIVPLQDLQDISGFNTFQDDFLL